MSRVAADFGGSAGRASGRNSQRLFARSRNEAEARKRRNPLGAPVSHNPDASREYGGESERDTSLPSAAVLMLRVALHVILRHVLKVEPSTLSEELASVVGKRNALGVTLTDDFSDNAFLKKDKALLESDATAEADVLSFTMHDAIALHDIFQHVVFELWVEPKARRLARERMKQRHRPKTQTIG